MGDAPANIQDVLRRLKGVKRNNGYFMADCPVSGHESPRGHLTVKDAGDKVLATCHDRHSYEQICQALDFDSLTYSHNGDRSPVEAKTIVATYDYTDIKGKLLFQAVRYEPKSFSQRRPDGNGGWIWNLQGVEPVLYRLPQITEAINADQIVYICEGEKDADNLHKLGLCSTTAPMGAGKWRDSYSKALMGAAVVILPDKDEPGRKHAIQIAQSLTGKAKSVKLIELLGQGKDFTDWLVASGTKEQLLQIVADTLLYDCVPQPAGLPSAGSLITLRNMADVKAQAVDWLWFPYIPKGKLTMLEGNPGIGKSWLSLAIATSLSLGSGLPGVEIKSPAKVLLASAEDGLADTIRPRLDALKADTANISAIEGPLTFDDNGLNILKGYIENECPALLIVDPLVAYLGGDVDLHRANETRQVMAKMARLAESYNLAILSVRHLTKGGIAQPLYRGIGSIDLLAACRSVLLAGTDANDSSKRGLVHIKSNLAPQGPAIAYEIKDGVFYWLGESDLTAGRILAAPESETSSSPLEEAMAFLKDELIDGPIDAAMIWKAARDQGLSVITVKRAKSKIGVLTRRVGDTGKRGGGKFIWELPNWAKDSIQVKDDLEYQGDHIKENDTLNSFSFDDSPEKPGTDTLNIANIPTPAETIDRREAVLGLPVERAIALWRAAGAPTIQVVPGEYCRSLDKLLANPDCQERHLKGVRAWLDNREPFKTNSILTVN